MADREKNPWTTLSTTEIYKNPWIRVREDRVLCPDGSAGIYGVVEPKLAAGTAALDDRGNLVLVGQYRYPVQQYSWEIIEGAVEANEDPLAAARRELEEEAGLAAAEWRPLGGEIHLSNCFSNERAYLFTARVLSDVPRRPDPTEVLQVRRVPFAEALHMVERGEIKDALSIIAVLRLARPGTCPDM